MSAIKIEKLTKRFKDTLAVDNLDLTVEEGEIFALLGVNGAGKTTTVKMLSCLIKPDGGNAFVCGYSILSDQEKVKDNIDVSMQETSIARNLTVKENLDFYSDLRGLTRENKRRVIENLYDVFGFKNVENKRAKTLSGGWQRKLSIALALVSSPKVLFLDEPTLGLDVIARRELWKTIESLRGKHTIVLTTHYMEEAEALSDRIGIMKDGKLIAVGTKEELYKRASADNLEDAFIKIIEEGRA